MTVGFVRAILSHALRAFTVFFHLSGMNAA